MNNSKAAKYSRVLIADTMILLVLSILAFLSSPLLGAIYVVYEIIILCNAKKFTKKIGIASLVLGIVVILTSFNVFLILLGIVYVIHSVLFLKNVDDNYVQAQRTEVVEAKNNSPLIYATLIPFVLTIAFYILNHVYADSEFLSSPEILIATLLCLFIINVANIFLCTKLLKKSMHVIVVLSLIFSIFGSLILFIALFMSAIYG